MMHMLLKPLFQPIADREGGVYAYEALMRLRWCAASPARMVQRWERSGFIKTADLAMLRRIGEILVVNKSRPRIAVNVSIATVEAAGDDYVRALVRVAPYARRLIVELTETAAVTDASAVLRFCRACRNQGITVALDDCRPGHPYGTAAFIGRFRPQLVKLDGQYLQECHRSGRVAGLLEMIEAAHDHRAGVIAECVSSPELREFAFQIGADYAQGFALGMPAPLASTNGSVYTYSVFS